MLMVSDPRAEPSPHPPWAPEGRDASELDVYDRSEPPRRSGALSPLERIPHRILRTLSHHRNRQRRAEIVAEDHARPYNPRKAEKTLRAFRPHMKIEGARVLDVGCGHGDLSIGLALAGAGKVVGIDQDPSRIEGASAQATKEGVADRVRFRCLDFVLDHAPEGEFDYVFSIGTFEHIPEPLAALERIRDCLRPGGGLLARFGPLWWSPYGAHMWDFTRFPWVHALFPERVVLRVREEVFRPDERVERYEDIVGRLNRMTVGKFRRLAERAGFRIRKFRVNPEKDQKWGGALRPLNSLLNRTPGLRELGALSLLAVLDRA
jgi:2-polyprenyl-3-methyl-5-hydroxy-6-metoxy-1,4-benzoquinol methylase